MSELACMLMYIRLSHANLYCNTCANARINDCENMYVCLQYLDLLIQQLSSDLRFNSV